MNNQSVVREWQYVCGDFSRQFSAPEGRLFTTNLFTGEIQELLLGQAGHALDLFVKGFGQDLAGEVYLLASTALGPVGDTGVVLKLMASPTNFTPEPPTAAVLTGSDAGTDSTATGLATLRPGPDVHLRPSPGPAAQTMSYALNAEGLSNVTMAHIHIASEPGGTGAPAVWLYPATPPAVAIPGEFTGLLAEGIITDAALTGSLAGLTLTDLMTAVHEHRAYVNVHTEQFPGGEIRGWLE